MALGWDMAFAEAAIQQGIPLIAAVPFTGQELRWSYVQQRVYYTILDRAADVVIVSPGGYSSESMQVRNRWMVDNADAVAALWNGSSGGTANCVRYAKSVNRPIVNLWSEFINDT